MTFKEGAGGLGSPPKPAAIAIGQTWSAWIPGRQQWLLATVVGFEKELVKLKCDARYGMKQEGDFKTDQGTMLENRNLFRFIGSAA